MFAASDVLAVERSVTGVPVRVLDRQGRVWKVAAEPFRWFERIAWWELPRDQVKGVDQEVMQIQVQLNRSSVPLTLELFRQGVSWVVREVIRPDGAF
jgi:hypothetical protein